MYNASCFFSVNGISRNLLLAFSTTICISTVNGGFLLFECFVNNQFEMFWAFNIHIVNKVSGLLSQNLAGSITSTYIYKNVMYIKISICLKHYQYMHTCNA